MEGRDDVTYLASGLNQAKSGAAPVAVSPSRRSPGEKVGGDGLRFGYML